MTASVLVRGGRIINLDGPGAAPADVRVCDGIITEIGRDLPSDGERIVDASGGWLIPGLWDAHVHFGQWVRSWAWINVAGAMGPEEVGHHIAIGLGARRDEDRLVIGFGYRSASWERLGTVAELDAVTGSRPVVVISGDAHNGWLNSAALERFGLPPRTGPISENDWFPLAARLAALPETEPDIEEQAAAVAHLASRGVVGLVDLEFGNAFHAWPARVAAGIDSLRVRPGVYPHQLDEVIGRGWRTGDPLGSDLITMGPLKIISDGSLSTRSAWCCEAYLDTDPDDPHRCGAPNVTPQELDGLLLRAREAGLKVAVHAIGDRANAAALDAFARTGAVGSIEHAQLLRRADVGRFAQLKITASMQPHHLHDDRDTATRLWGEERASRTFLARSLLTSGATLALGSDAPVSPLDPWLAMSAAVHRSADDRPGHVPEESLTPLEALRSSVDGRRIAVGQPGDVVILGLNPFVDAPTSAEQASALLQVPVHATICAGKVTHDAAGS